MSVTLILVLLWVAFTITHVWPTSPSVRPKLIERLGAGPYQGLFSLVALGIFVPLVTIYMRNRHEGTDLWDLWGVPGIWQLSTALSGIGFAMLVASFFQPSPFSMGAKARPEPYGLTRITRHPLFMPLLPVAIGHLLLWGWATDVAFFGGLAVYTVVGCAHQDKRKRLTEGDRLAAYFEKSSLLPFGAIVTGRNRLVLGELPWLGLAIGAAAAYGFYWLHPVMFG